MWFALFVGAAFSLLMNGFIQTRRPVMASPIKPKRTSTIRGSLSPRTAFDTVLCRASQYGYVIHGCDTASNLLVFTDRFLLFGWGMFYYAQIQMEDNQSCCILISAIDRGLPGLFDGFYFKRMVKRIQEMLNESLNAR